MNGWRRCIVLVIFAYLSGFYAGHSNTLLSWIVPAAVMGVLGFIIKSGDTSTNNSKPASR